MNQTTKLGLIGCGAISGIYLQNAKRFKGVEIVACADTRLQAAQARAEEYGVPKACSVEELLADPEIEIVINLTPHLAHAEVGLAALEAGKSIYNEKPLAVYREDGLKMLSLAQEKGLRVGGAPDTFIGGAWQTARKLIDQGAIGEPVAAFACLQARRGPRPGRPRPANPDGYVSFYRTHFFEYGVTWSFDRGPYYLTALINLLGPVSRVTASARKTWEEREDAGALVEVHAPTHVAGVLDFTNGAVCTVILTADVYGDRAAAHRDLWQRGLAALHRPQQLWRDAVSAPGGQPGSDPRRERVRVQREQPGRRRRRHGRGQAQRPAAPRQRRDGLPRDRHRQRLSRRLAREPARRAGQHVRPARAAAGRSGGLDDRRLGKGSHSTC